MYKKFNRSKLIFPCQFNYLFQFYVRIHFIVYPLVLSIEISLILSYNFLFYFLNYWFVYFVLWDMNKGRLIWMNGCRRFGRRLIGRVAIRSTDNLAESPMSTWYEKIKKVLRLSLLEITICSLNHKVNLGNQGGRAGNHPIIRTHCRTVIMLP